MSAWETREAAFEKGFEIDSELRFKSLARRNKLVGLWAAEKLGLSDENAQAYAMRLVDAEIGADDESLASRLALDLAKLEPPVSTHRIHRSIAELTARAMQEVFEGR